jgi:dihydroorotate dehydrogenase (fumarate)
MTIDLSTRYLGLTLRNPLVVSSSSLTDSVDKVRALEEAGAGAVVLKSIFEEQIVLEGEKLDATLGQGAQAFAEAQTYFADIPMTVGPEEYVRLVEGAKKAVRIPVIGSINCASAKAWPVFARHVESAGADALELNIYRVPADPARTGAQVERTYLDIVDDVRSRVKLPIAVKLSPFHSSIPNLVAEIAKRGAQAVVLFNRFYQPDFDLDALGIASRLQLSRPEDALLPIRWIALLYGRIAIDFAATTGVHDGRTALKTILAGASVAQVSSAIFKHKAGHLGVMLREMQAWMQDKDYGSIADIRGILSEKTCPDPEAFERAQYIKILVGHD